VALWKEQTAPRKDAPAAASDFAARKDSDASAEPSYIREMPRRAAPRDAIESVIGADLTIEGKIEGSGHIRVAGRFKGDVTVEGNLTIESGAKLAGGVRAHAVTIAGELDGNIPLTPPALNCRVRVLSATSRRLAAGSRMREVEPG
jgi:hypothetical protein